MTLKDLSIDSTWTLFLDRDGVINRKLEGDYVKHWIEFEFLDGVLKALKTLSTVFGRLIVVTNQQGIGKGIMRVEELELIHKNMLYEINYFGGKIDKVLFAPQLASENSAMRKPEIGMAHEARRIFPEINFNNSIMVGDSLSDMEFGRKAGMYTVFISENSKSSQFIDFHCTSLSDFSNKLRNENE